MTTRYSKDHEWVRLDGAIATVGITEHAQEQLGDVVFVELPEPGTVVRAHDKLAVVESVKAASEVYAPVSGKVVEVNAGLVDEPALVNQSAEDRGWFAKLEPSDPAELDRLMDKAAYDAFLATL